MRGLRPRELVSILRRSLVGNQFLKTTPYLSIDDMRHWQWQRISELVRHAYERVPFYREHYGRSGFTPDDLRSWRDFEMLPTVSKDDVIANYPDRMLAEGYDPESLIVSRSSGSSGKPMDIAYDAEAMAVYTLAGLRLYRMGFDYRPWHRQVYVYTSPYPFNSLFGLFPLTFVSTLTPIDDIVNAIRAVRPHLLVCYPSHLNEIARRLSRADIARIPLRAVSVNSEMSTQAERSELAAHFGCPVLDEYSSEELTRIAAQCRHGHYHIFEDINYMEVRPDPKDPGGAGLLIGTNLHNYAMPMIRYEQNDIGAISTGVTACACGWHFRTLSQFQGRRNDSFRMPSGRTITSGFLLDATYEFLLRYRSEVRDFCLIQDAIDHVILEIEPGQGWNAEVASRISERLCQLLEPAVRVEVKEVAECTKTRSGKKNPIICRLNSSPTTARQILPDSS